MRTSQMSPFVWPWIHNLQGPSSMLAPSNEMSSFVRFWVCTCVTGVCNVLKGSNPHMPPSGWKNKYWNHVDQSNWPMYIGQSRENNWSHGLMRVMMRMHYCVNEVLICQVWSQMENSIRCAAHILHMVIVYKQSPHLLEIVFLEICPI